MDHLPFKVKEDPLVPSNIERNSPHFPDFQELKNSKRLIRTFSFHHFESLPDVASIEQAAVKIKRMFAELKEFSLPVVAEWFVGKNQSGEKILYCASSKIDGVALDKNKVFKEEEREIMYQEADAIFSNLVDYLTKKFFTREPLLLEVFHEEQFTVGRKSGDKENHIYLTDTDPVISRDDSDFDIGLSHIIESIYHLEKKLGKPLFKTIKKIEELLSLDTAAQAFFISRKKAEELLL